MKIISGSFLDSRGVGVPKSTNPLPLARCLHTGKFSKRTKLDMNRMRYNIGVILQLWASCLFLKSCYFTDHGDVCENTLLCNSCYVAFSLAQSE